jgi:hypothetical protein
MLIYKLLCLKFRPVVICFTFDKTTSRKVAYPLFENTKFQDPLLNDASYAPTWEVRRAPCSSNKFKKYNNGDTSGDVNPSKVHENSSVS